MGEETGRGDVKRIVGGYTGTTLISHACSMPKRDTPAGKSNDCTQAEQVSIDAAPASLKNEHSQSIVEHDVSAPKMAVRVSEH